MTYEEALAYLNAAKGGEMRWRRPVRCWSICVIRCSLCLRDVAGTNEKARPRVFIIDIAAGRLSNGTFCLHVVAGFWEVFRGTGRFSGG
jgi:hypothetical protein